VGVVHLQAATVSPPGRPKGEQAPERASAKDRSARPPGRPKGEQVPERASAKDRSVRPPGRPKGEQAPERASAKGSPSPAEPSPDARTTPQAAGMTSRNRRTLILLALVTAAPVVASYTAYYLWPRDRHVNYGELLPTAPAPALHGTRDGKPFALSDLRGKWVLVMAADAACDASCAQALYATRQARTIQGREMERVVRVWLVPAGAPSGTVMAEHPDLAVVTAAAGLAGFPAGRERIYLLDPLGNQVLAYPRDPDIKAMARDLTRLLRASRIG